MLYRFAPKILSALFALLLLPVLTADAQGSATDYQRSADLPNQFRGKVTQQKLEPVWVGEGDAFWYRTDDRNGMGRWVRVDCATGEQTLAFDHAAFAAALGEASGKRIDSARLALDGLRVVEDGTFTFVAIEQSWRYDPANQSISKHEGQNSLVQGIDRETLNERRRERRHDVAQRSPDGHWTARTHEGALRLRSTEESGIDWVPLAEADQGTDGGFTNRFYWSSDSKYFVAIHRTPGDERRVTIIDSMPEDQLQPKTESYNYLKPGDKVTIDRPRLFNIDSLEEITTHEDLAPNPYRISDIRWRKDSSTYTYEYNPRGHQGYRVIEVDAATGESRVVIDEQTDTFFCYSYKKYLKYLDATNEIVWMSESDGWNHLYLYDWATGEVKRQITTGQWIIREVDRVGEQSRQIWFWACGVRPEQDPYHRHYCRVEIDTGEVTVLTEGDGDHTDLSISPNDKYLVTTWSRIDHPPVHELRDAQTGELIREIARADASRLIDAGWVAPEPFAAKGRDGETDIYGYLVKPTNFDPDKKYPVIEYIYAGPHDQHVEKRFYEVMRIQQLAELGFIVVRIDGMGTNWRSKAFHDVCWKNLKDAGFPDRIAWMKAAAETRPWMDIERVGIYGGSAGGQNAMRAVLDHANFYDAAAADCGCHDNRMDKIWWNEQWMGWPVDQSYLDSSNVVDAHKLGGALLLTVGELDRNVDPASTMQVVDALIKADKDFELIVFPGRGHGAGSSRYGTRRMYDFFVRELYGNIPRAE